MNRKLAVLTIVASVTGLAGLSRADEVTTYRAVEETSVVTTSATTPTSDMTTPAAPLATDANATQASVPVAATEEATTDEAMAGTVQSVDRRNRSLVVQDSKGKNYSVSLTDNTRFYRKGEEVNYRDIEPNDVIQIRSRS
jgi:hypothetical protein